MPRHTASNLLPNFSPDELHTQLSNHSRAPFTAALARFLANAPSDQAISDEAEKYPNRWTQNIVMLQRAAGYTDKQELEVTVLQQIQRLSDSELEAEIAKLELNQGHSNSTNMIDQQPPEATGPNETE